MTGEPGNYPPAGLPVYARASIAVIGLFVLFSILYALQQLLLPIIYAAIIATLIRPAVNVLTKRRVPRTLAILMIMTVAALALAALLLLIYSQFSRFKAALPQLVAAVEGLLRQAVSWVSVYFHISTEDMDAWIYGIQSELLNNTSGKIGITLSAFGSALATLLLTPVYVFMLLLYQQHLVEFIRKLFGIRNDDNVSEILFETQKIIQHYLNGLFAEFTLVAGMNSIGLLLIGIEYAILLGITAAFLNVIPYLGGLMGVTIFIIMALVTKAPIYALYVFALYVVIQFVDNNLIVPKIVGSKVQLNALVSLTAVIAGAALWGIPGMFLSIPLVAIIKVVMDRVEGLKPWGFLLGETPPALGKVKYGLIKIRKRRKPAGQV